MAASTLTGLIEEHGADLTEMDWERVQAAIAAADFWSFAANGGPLRHILDGFHLIVEGRRAEQFHASRFRQPELAEYRQLGRLAFDLGGLVEVDL
jgi:hypothetical protein